MGLSKTTSLTLLALLAGVAASADEESLLIRGTLNPRLEVVAPFVQSDEDGTVAVPRWQTNDVTGSSARFEKYSVAPAGGYLERLQIIGISDDTSSLLLRLNAPGQPVSSGLLSWRNFNTLTRADLTGSRYHFNLYPGSGQALRQNLDLTGRTLLADGKTRASIVAKTDYLRLPKPGGVLNHTINNYRLDLTRPVGWGDVDVVLALREYRNLDGLQPGTSWGQYALRYSLDLPVATLGAEYAFTQLDHGTASPRVSALGIRATSAPGSALIATASLSSRRLSGAIERNGYTRGTDVGRVEVGYRGVRGLSLRAGYDRTEYDRVNRAQTLTEDIAWNRVWGSAYYRPIRRWQVVARASHRSNRTPPVSGLNDPTPLIFNLDRKAEVRVEGSPTDYSGVYLGGGARFRKNTRRNIEIETETTSVGGWLQLGDRLTLNADYGMQWVDSRNIELFGTLADSWVTTLGATVSVLPRTWVESTYSNYRTNRAENTHQNVWGLSLRREVGRGTSWNVEYRHDDFDDRTNPGLAYTANVFTVGGSGRF